MDRIQEYNVVAMEDYEAEWEQALAASLIMGGISPHAFPSTPLKFPPDDLFSNPINFFTAPNSGSTNLYDAIIAVGLGACRAISNTSLEEVNITGEMLQDNIRAVEFQGSVGDVRFGDGFPGSRAANSINYGVYNLFPDGNFL